jgi:DNA-binding NarL/FixJ family response regulator
MNIVIADYYALLRDGLGILVRELTDDVSILHCESFDGVLETLEQQSVALVLLDFNLPKLNGFASVRATRERFPDTPLVIMAASERWSDACGAIEAGARGYIPKSASSAIMLAALRLILSGGVYLPPLMNHANGAAPRHFASASDPDLAADFATDRRLTPRQLEVLRCLARGHSNKEIAYQLGLSQGTVKIHIAAIFRAFKVRNRTQAVIAAGLRP